MSQQQWNPISINFGVLSPGSKIEFKFERVGNKPIQKVKPSCSCVVMYYDEGKGTVTGTYTPGKKKLNTRAIKENKKTMTDVRKIIITYTDGSKQALTLIAQIRTN